jgi:raffinose/stachyose/melibiose transport system substrate-binding protein
MNKLKLTSVIFLVIAFAVGQGGWAAGNDSTLTILCQPTSVTSGLTAELDWIRDTYGIKTAVEVVAGGSEGVNVIKMRIATDELPDILIFNSGSLFTSLNPQSTFVPLTNEPFMKNVDEGFKKTVMVNNAVYGVPIRPMNFGGWLYNKKEYARLGLKVPKTWAELISNCEKIKASGKTAVIGSFKTSWTTQMIVLADFYNVQKLEPNFAADYTANKAKYATSKAALRSFEKLYEIYAKGFMNRDYMSTSYDDAQQMLVDGTGVQWPMLSQVLPVMAQKFPDKMQDIGMFPQPSDDPNINGFTVWMPNAFYITKSCKDIPKAKKFLEYYISATGLNIFKSAQTLDGVFLIKGSTASSDVLAAVDDIVKYTEEGKVAPALEFLSPVKAPNLPQICAEVGTGAVNALGGAKMADDDTTKQAKQLNLPGW